MKYEEYLAKRNQLMDEASALAEQGMFDEAEAKQSEVTALDEQWDKQAKYEANQRALNGQQRRVNMQNLGQGVIPTGLTAPVAQVGAKAEDKKPEDYLNSVEYENAWAKVMMNKVNQMTADERKALDMVNDAIETGTIQTGTQTAGSILIPNNVSQRIIRRIEDLHPLLADVTKTYIQGYLTLTLAGESSEAGWYEEATPTADGSETFRTVSLGGCELARKIVISYKLAEMSVNDFIAYVVEQMSLRMGAALAIGVIEGKGARSGYATEPTGILTAMAAESGTPQIIATGITEENLAAAMGKIPAVYRPKFYANRTTIWGALYMIKNENGDSIMVADPINGGVYKIFGIPVIEEAGIPDGQVLLSDAQAAYHLNFNKQIMLERDKNIENRTHIFAGYAIADGTVIAPKASVLVKNA